MRGSSPAAVVGSRCVYSALYGAEPTTTSGSVARAAAVALDDLEHVVLGLEPRDDEVEAARLEPELLDAVDGQVAR